MADDAVRSTDLPSVTDLDEFIGHALIGADVKLARAGKSDIAAKILAYSKLNFASVSSNKTLTAADNAVWQRVDASGAARIVTLPATAGLTDGFSFPIRKSDSSANTVTVRDASATSLAVLYSQYDELRAVCWGGAWYLVGVRLAPLTQVVTSSGTVSVPLLARSLDAMLISGGGGGGSGRRGAAGSIRGGGNGGNSGNVVPARFMVADLASTIAVTIGAGGAAGAAVTTDDTNGNAGGASGATHFGGASDPFRVSADAAYGGLGGTNTTNTQTTATARGFVPGQGASASAVGGLGGAAGPGTIAGGAAGGGVTAANNGGNGGGGRTVRGTSIAGGTAPGGAGTASSYTNGAFFCGGEAGSGGAGNPSGAGGAAGAPGGYGAPGSGGGAAVNGYASGAGSAGNAGAIILTWRF